MGIGIRAKQKFIQKLYREHRKHDLPIQWQLSKLQRAHTKAIRVPSQKVLSWWTRFRLYRRLWRSTVRRVQLTLMYSKSLDHCKKCPSKTHVILQLLALLAFVVIVMAVVVWKSKRKSEKNGTLIKKARSKSCHMQKKSSTDLRVFVTYLSTCSRIAHTLPLACRELCKDRHVQHEADYDIKCQNTTNMWLWPIASSCTWSPYLLLPLLCFGGSTGVKQTQGIRHIRENYCKHGSLIYLWTIQH